MGKDPAFLFYPGDWLGGTMGMTFEQKGCYLELLMMQFNNGRFTEEQAKQVLSICFSYAWPTLKHKFEFDGEFYWNKRLQIEIEKRKSYIESRRASGSVPKKKKAYEKHTLKRTHKRSENRNEDENIINIEFEIFWNLYDKKVGNKKNCEKKWNNLTDETRQKIVDTLPAFISGIRDKQYQPYPETYLNQERWNDEKPEFKMPFE